MDFLHNLKWHNSGGTKEAFLLKEVWNLNCFLST
ncbi:rCG60472 [Rattus norvegicus]|uniref:RCG60472 n=1 Tax=Rattus norvegicus TaxID=10116 RepID=A6KK50_RAT|nr:rCG60472 [Rattus norvegicus]